MSTNKAESSGTILLIITVLGSGFVAGIIPAGVLPANVLNIEHAYNLSHAQVGRIVGLCMIFGGATGGLLGGWICGKIGALRNVLLALVMSAIALGCIGLIPHVAATVGGLAAYFFAMGFMGSSNTLATHMLPDRQRGIALLHATNASGKLAGPLLASLFIAGAWRYSFLASAILPAILIIPTLLTHSNGYTDVGQRAKHTKRPGTGFWIAISAFAFIAGSEIAVAMWLPAYAYEMKGFSEERSKQLLSIFLTGMITGRVVSSALSKMVSSRMVIAACGIFLIALVPALQSSAYFTLAFWLFFLGVGFSAIWPSYFAHISRIYPEHIGMMGGGAVFATQMGFAACSAVSGRLADIDLACPLIFGASLMALFVVAFFASPIGRRAKGVESI